MSAETEGETYGEYANERGETQARVQVISGKDIRRQRSQARAVARINGQHLTFSGRRRERDTPREPAELRVGGGETGESDEKVLNGNHS